MQNFKRMALFLAGTALAITPYIAKAETIKIGVSQPLTGAVAASGNYVVQGAKIAESFLNDSGGFWGNKSSSSSRITKVIQKKPWRRPKS